MWSKACDRAFARLKTCLASSEVLAQYDVFLPVKLDCDAFALKKIMHKSRKKDWPWCLGLRNSTNIFMGEGSR